MSTPARRRPRRPEPAAEQHLGPARLIALAALLLAVGLLAWLLFLRGSPYTVGARFSSASLVGKGNVVKVAGREVGTVTDVDLSPTGAAELEMEIDDDEITPLREGTEAHLRLSSLTSANGRYVDLRIPPDGGGEIEDGGMIELQDTQGIVDLDQFFNMFDKRGRRGLTAVIRGSGRQFGGAQEFVDAGWRHLNPSFVASTRLFEQLNQDSRSLRRFLGGSSRLVGALASRKEDLTRLVDRLATTTGAIAREERALSEAIGVAPDFLRRANTTYVNLRATLDDLDPLVDASKPVAPRLDALLRELQPFARDARAPVRTLADVVRTPGDDNDLTDLSIATPPLRDITVRTAERNGEERRGSLPEATEAFRRQSRQWAFWRPYAPDIIGFFKAFGNVGIYDANGVASRAATLPGSTENAPPSGGIGTPIPPPERQAFIDQFLIKQLNRCPGSVERPAPDGSNPWRPTPQFNCDPSVLPIGR